VGNIAPEATTGSAGRQWRSIVTDCGQAREWRALARLRRQEWGIPGFNHALHILGQFGPGSGQFIGRYVGSVSLEAEQPIIYRPAPSFVIRTGFKESQDFRFGPDVMMVGGVEERGVCHEIFALAIIWPNEWVIF